MILRISCLCLFVISIFCDGTAQKPERWTSGEVYEGIQRLRVLGSALYIAAHPDDENTRLISHLANDRKVRTAYLSLTRGDGGQNLIGSEIGDLLGVIRTQELLQARRTDHGEQWFTRAIDFGYSKTPDETLKIWNKEEVLADVIRTIRIVKPDVIINRFDAKPSPGNHGHHVASAMLSVEAFGKAGDARICSDQLASMSTWTPRRLFFNTSWWFYGSRENFENADKSRMVQVEVGAYDPLTGLSNTEIAAASRSMHKSQGFGSAGARGLETEYLELIEGSKPADMKDVFQGIDITWNRLKNGGPIDQLLERVEQTYDFKRPYKSVDALLHVRREIGKLEHSDWKVRKLLEIEEVIAQAMGLFLEADAADYYTAPGDTVMIQMEVINRSPLTATLVSTTYEPVQTDLSLTGTLNENQKISASKKIVIDSSFQITSPYWLTNPPGKGLYTVEDAQLRGLPETPRAASVGFNIVIQSDTVLYRTPIVYKETDPVDGEKYRPFEIVPPVFVNMLAPVYIFREKQPVSVDVKLQASQIDITGIVRLEVPEGWNVEPATREVSFNKKGQEAFVTFVVTAGETPDLGTLKASVEVGGQRWTQMLTEVSYPHIPAQAVLREASAKAVRVNLQRGGSRIAYIHGAGDDVAASLQQVGYSVDILNANDIINSEMLKRYDAVVLGIRAYNTIDRLVHVQEHLFNFAHEGGTVITQYNTTQGLRDVSLAPFDLSISRQRVTDETAKVTFLAPDHRALTTPNKLDQADFTGWVQEMGLYFPDRWDPAFTPLLSMSDPGEDPLSGALLVAEYGKGYIVYTSLSFFRQLPDGVPGAYRLFANLLALSQMKRS